MKDLSLPVVVVVLFGFFSGSFESGAFGQTKEETITFLKEKCTLRLPLANDGSYQMCTIAFDNNGTLQTVTSYYLKNGSPSPADGSIITRVLLKDLNPKRAEFIKSESAGTAYYIVVLECTGRKKRVTRDSGQRKDEFDELGICVPDERTAKQVAKGFQHLIKLSGGKAELFDDD